MASPLPIVPLLRLTGDIVPKSLDQFWTGQPRSATSPIDSRRNAAAIHHVVDGATDTYSAHKRDL